VVDRSDWTCWERRTPRHGLNRRLDPSPTCGAAMAADGGCPRHNVWGNSRGGGAGAEGHGLEAKQAWSSLAREFGEPAFRSGTVGDGGLPDAVVRRVPSWTWRRNGVDRARSDTIMRLAAGPHVLRRLPTGPS
jgi:hypothetical protein